MNEIEWTNIFGTGEKASSIVARALSPSVYDVAALLEAEYNRLRAENPDAGYRELSWYWFVEMARQVLVDATSGQGEIEAAKLVLFTPDQLSTQPEGTWDDNGGEPDGFLWLLPLDQVEPFEGMVVVDGYIVHGYSSEFKPNNLALFCGFSSRGAAYTTRLEEAQAIAEAIAAEHED